MRWSLQVSPLADSLTESRSPFASIVPWQTGGCVCSWKGEQWKTGSVVGYIMYVYRIPGSPTIMFIGWFRPWCAALLTPCAYHVEVVRDIGWFRNHHDFIVILVGVLSSSKRNYHFLRWWLTSRKYMYIYTYVYTFFWMYTYVHAPPKHGTQNKGVVQMFFHFLNGWWVPFVSFPGCIYTENKKRSTWKHTIPKGE